MSRKLYGPYHPRNLLTKNVKIVNVYNENHMPKKETMGRLNKLE